MARRILLADDSVTAQNMGRRILSDAGYEVVTVNNGSAALKKIAEQKPDLIVLDVYMPGYGGLEVCQRIKENRETARIPVLLTVGKLEPFKPEEARRVRADAFIVKPFEASELLTALTKLEDKIVPQGPQKPGRFAKALAAMEQSGEKDDRFGNSETGWKDRLSIPPPAAKSAQSEAEAPQMPSAVVRELWRDADSRPAEPKPGFERPIPAGLPPDITPEEIAAITAAAAAFGSKPEEIAAKPASEAVAEPGKSQAVAETPAATVASAPEAEAVTAEAKPAVSEAQPAAEAQVTNEAAKADENPVAETPVATDLPAAQAEKDSEAKGLPEAPAVEPGKPWTGDAEVLAAIASLAPTNGHADGSWQPAEPGAGSAHEAERLPATVSAAMANASAAAETFSGPRWIAEAIPVLEDESRFILEQEMEKAYAAFAAAEGDRTRSAAAAVATTSSIEIAERQSPEAPAVVENTGGAAAEVTAMPTEVSTAISPAKEEAAYAAAASASAVAEGATTEANAQTVAAPKPEENTSSAAEEGGNQREAELAAAWQNWKQIRESIVGSQLTAQIADAAAAELKDVQRGESSAAPSENAETTAGPDSDEPSSAARTESTAIASIVDSVLAELKPKLVEEIAKKMSTDKKEKEKKKKK